MQTSDRAIVQTTVGQVVLRKRGNVWHARKQKGKERFELSLKTGDFEKAAEIARELMPAKVLGIEGYSKDAGSIPKLQDYRRKFVTAKARAARNSVEYTLTQSDEDEIIARAGGFCEVTGMAFSMARRDDNFRAPFAPSIDRIDSAKGYTKDNSRLVCVVVNWALSDWGIGVFDRMCSNYAAAKLRKSAA